MPPDTTAPRAPWWMLPGLAALLLAIFAGALAASCFLGNDTLRTQMFTGALTLATGAAGFFFGSSNGSQKKDDTNAVAMTALANGMPVVPPPPAPVAPSPMGGFIPAKPAP